MRRKNTSCSLFFWHDFFFSGVETFHSPQRNAAKEYFVLAMAAMQVLLSLLALLGQRYKHCVAAKVHFFFGARYGRNTGTTQLLPKLLASLAQKYK
jgi:hypothetical protein